MQKPVGYLTPYVAAAAVHGAGFASLLWASRQTQRARFAAIAETVRMKDKFVLDVGCGHGDFLSFLVSRNEAPSQYVGIEAVPQLAACARSVVREDDMILEVDFVDRPARMMIGAHVVVISGAINTLDYQAATRVLEFAWHAAADALVFNFLASPEIAQADYLYWHRCGVMLEWARTRDASALLRTDYLEGDATIAMFKRGA